MGDMGITPFRLGYLAGQQTSLADAQSEEFNQKLVKDINILLKTNTVTGIDHSKEGTEKLGHQISNGLGQGITNSIREETGSEFWVEGLPLLPVDKDGNGKLTATDTGVLFSSLDTNQDGSIKPSEHKGISLE